MSDLKFQPIFDSYEQLGVNVGDTRRNSQGLAIFNAVQADCILEKTIKELEDQQFFGLQGDGSHDKACQIWGDTIASKRLSKTILVNQEVIQVWNGTL